MTIEKDRTTVHVPEPHKAMRIHRLTDKGRILRFLETDPSYAAYATGDLEPSLFRQTRWIGAELAGQLCTIALLFKGIDPPALFLMGDPAGLSSILHLRMRARRVYVTCKPEHLPPVRAFYQAEEPIPMWRMTVQAGEFRPVQSAEATALSPRHTEELERLYALGGGKAFSPTQLATGVYFGIVEYGQVVAAAGTHLISPTYGLAAIGNVYTEESQRGRGYGTATTSAVLAQLFERGIRQVFLNVAQTNTIAIGIYERLGFTKSCAFLEMLAVRKQ
jgi:RimJ/RimL family protein N-acetyltransferase